MTKALSSLVCVLSKQKNSVFDHMFYTVRQAIKGEHFCQWLAYKAL